MEYSANAKSISKKNAAIKIKASEIIFGTTSQSEDNLPNPAELFLGAFAACILKNVERFSDLMKFEYSSAEIQVKAIRLEKPPRMDSINYDLKIYSEDENLNSALLQKNIEKFGTIFNTVKLACTVTGAIKKIAD